MNFEQAVNLINSLTNSSLETYKQFCKNQEKILKRLDAIATPTVKPMVEDLLKNDFVNYPDANYVAVMACEGLPTWIDCYGKRAVINFAKQLKSVMDELPPEGGSSEEVIGSLETMIEDMESKRVTMKTTKSHIFRLIESDSETVITGSAKIRLETATRCRHTSDCAYFINEAIKLIKAKQPEQQVKDPELSVKAPEIFNLDAPVESLIEHLEMELVAHKVESVALLVDMKTIQATRLES